MCFGRLNIEKGILDLLDAWSRIKNAEALLVVVGLNMTGHHMDVRSMVKERVDRHRLKDRVILHGPFTSVTSLLQAADIFVQLSHYKAFGISVLEEMATWVSVVASRVQRMLDYLIDECNVLFVASKSPEEITGKIRRCNGLDRKPGGRPYDPAMIPSFTKEMPVCLRMLPPWGSDD